MNPILPCLLTFSLFPLAAAVAAPAAPLWSSHRLTPETVGHSVPVKVEFQGAKKLFLVVTDGGDGFACDWCNWVNPVLKGSFGEKSLTELKPVRSESGWGKVGLNANAAGQPMSVDGKPAGRGFGVHAPSLLEFDLPEGTTGFEAVAALDDGGTRQGGGSTVFFKIFTSNPPSDLVQKSGPGGTSGAKDPEAARAGLSMAPGLQVGTFAHEPMLLSPSAIDVDHLGRVWVAEIVNYRAHNGKRAEGDRILVLEDTDHDGKADRQTVFHEGKDIISPHGVTVLGNRVIVSASGKVLVFTDDNGDLKADRSEVLFSGVAGSQHDHGIHAVHFGPDGCLYFNFGNAGEQLRDRDGKLVVDAAGNPIQDKRQPYQQGMIFRCRMDGSKVETLAWNFRNNWELAVDSFGNLWQSDNDDDGNQSVRINFVLPYGNYGFKDELTGAQWTKGEAKSREDVARRHWHQADPGVVPNLLDTGAGSPTGIVVYEGNLLPAVYHQQMIHCDAGPNVVRSYPVKPAGAGYTASTVPLMEGTGDRWFRPSDVVVAPDGSLVIADWYDPGVGGHAMGDLDHGRIYRVTPTGHKGYTVSAPDLSTPEGAVAALSNPNEAARYLGYTTLIQMGTKALPALRTLRASSSPVLQARALWILSTLPETASEAVEQGLKSDLPEIRITALRAALAQGKDPVALAKSLATHPCPATRREAAIALRFSRTPEAAEVWAELAARHDGTDRWYLEALGIGADLHWDECLSAYLKKVPQPETTPAGRDLIWRSRATNSATFLARIVKNDTIPENEKDRYMRAFDYQPAAEKEKALQSLLE